MDETWEEMMLRSTTLTPIVGEPLALEKKARNRREREEVEKEIRRLKMVATDGCAIA